MIDNCPCKRDVNGDCPCDPNIGRIESSKQRVGDALNFAGSALLGSSIVNKDPGGGAIGGAISGLTMGGPLGAILGAVSG